MSNNPFWIGLVLAPKASQLSQKASIFFFFFVCKMWLLKYFNHWYRTYLFCGLGEAKHEWSNPHLALVVQHGTPLDSCLLHSTTSPPTRCKWCSICSPCSSNSWRVFVHLLVHANQMWPRFPFFYPSLILREVLLPWKSYKLLLHLLLRTV